MAQIRIHVRGLAMVLLGTVFMASLVWLVFDRSLPEGKDVDHGTCVESDTNNLMAMCLFKDIQTCM